MSLVNFKKGSLAGYNGIAVKDENTLYFVTDKGLLYLGEKLLAATSIAQKSEGVYTITYIDSTNTPQTIDVATTDKISNYISSAIEALDTTNDVVVASKSGDVVTLTAGIKEVDGIIAKGSEADITLGTAAVKNYQTEAIPTTGVVSSTNLVSAAQVATYVESKMSGVVGAMVYQGTIGITGDNPTITSLPEASSSNKGYVYVVKTAGTYASKACEVGDMIISNGESWDVINGENQVTNNGATITPGAEATTIATVDGIDITVSVAGLSASDSGTGNVVTGITASGNEITVTKGNVIESVTGETAISGGNSDYVAVSAETTSNAVTLSSTVKTQNIASAAQSADGLATAYDIKTNVADNAVLTGYASALTGTISAASTITSAIKSLETAITWGSF